MPAYGIRKIHQRADTFLVVVPGQHFRARHADLVYRHGIRRGLVPDRGKYIRGKSLYIFRAQVARNRVDEVTPRPRIGIAGHSPDRRVQQFPINTIDRTSQQSVKNGSRQLTMRELDGVSPDDRLNGFHRIDDNLEKIHEDRPRPVTHVPDGFGRLDPQKPVIMFQKAHEDRQRIGAFEIPQRLTGTLADMSIRPLSHGNQRRNHCRGLGTFRQLGCSPAAYDR